MFHYNRLSFPRNDKFFMSKYFIDRGYDKAKFSELAQWLVINKVIGKPLVIEPCMLQVFSQKMK